MYRRDFVNLLGAAVVGQRNVKNKSSKDHTFQNGKFVELELSDDRIAVEDLRFSIEGRGRLRGQMNVRNKADDECSISVHFAFLDSGGELVTTLRYDSASPPLGGFEPREAYLWRESTYFDTSRRIVSFKVSAWRRD